MPRYDNVVFDLDSTLSTIEGIDELARLRGVVDQVAPLTMLGMAGKIPTDKLFLKRLAIAQPSRADLEKIGDLYCDNITPGALEVVSTLHTKGSRIFLVSGGYNPAAQIVGDYLGIPRTQVFANELHFDTTGRYTDIDRSIPLWRNHGKTEVIRQLQTQYDGTWLMVGDSMSDWETTELVDGFVCFAGVVARPEVIAKSRSVVTTKNLADILNYC